MMRNIHFPLKNIYFFLILLVILLAGVGNVDGATRFSVATGNWSSTATWAATSGGTAGASVPVAGDVVTIEGGWTVTVDANSACATLNIASSSTLNFVDTKNFTVSGVTSISGTLNINAYNGTKSFRGLVTVNSGGIWNNSAGSPVNFRGGITNNGTFTVGTGPQTFTNNAQSLTGTLDFSGAAVTITTINLTNQGTLTLTANLSGTGALINSTTGTLNIGGTQTASIATFTNQGTLNLTSSYGINTAFTNTGIVNVQSSGYIAGITNSTGGILNISALSYNINSLTATVAGNTVNYSGLGAQTVINTTYSNLTLSGSGVKTVTGATVGGNLVVSGSATVTPSATFGVAGTTTLSGTSVLTLGAANILSNTGAIALNGGTFSTGAGVGFSETIGVLSMNASSTIALGTGVHTLTIADSHSASWTGTLTITGWGTGTAGKIQVGVGGLSTAQLAQISFSGYPSGTVITSTGELVPNRNYWAQFTAMNIGSTTWCQGETRTVSVTVKNIGTQIWTNSAPDINIGIKWNADADYLVRTDANGLAPGATQTYSLTVTAPAAGTNNLTFDVVNEGNCWFGNNNGSCGPGNSVYASSAITINSVPTQPSAITGSTTPCQGSSQTYSVTNVSGVTYAWTLPSGWTGSSTTNSITVTVGATSGNVQVTPSNTCGSGTASTLATTVTTSVPGVAGTITGSASVYRGQTGVAYSVGTISGATSYTWAYTTGTGATINGTTNNVTIDFASTATSGNLTVKGTNSCGSGTVSANYAITVTAPPCITSQPSNVTVCPASTTSFSIATTGTGFQWQRSTDSGATWTNITAAGTNPTYAGYNSSKTLTLTNVVAANNGYQYRCVVSTGCPATSNAAKLNVGMDIYSPRLSANPDLINPPATNSTISLTNTQLGLSYQLMANKSTAVGSPVVGTGGSIDFAAVTLSSSTNFTVIATSISSGCRDTINDKKTVIVNEDGLIIDLHPCAGQPGSNFFSNSEFGTTATNNYSTPDPTNNPGVIFGKPLGAYTTYTFGFVNGEIPDGNYVIANSTAGMYRQPPATDNNVWLLTNDRSTPLVTPPTVGTGHMFIVNAAYAPGNFYSETLTGLCDSTKYEFSAEIINLYASNWVPNGTDVINYFPTDDQGNQYTVLPNIDFLINGKVAFNTGNIMNDGVWHTVGFTFRTGGLSSITLTMRNNAPGGIGNDIALDNIVMRACGPKISLNILTTLPVCPGTPVTMTAQIIASDYKSPVYQWQTSTDGGINWNNISGANSTSYTENNPISGHKYRYITGETIPSLTNPNCFVASDPVTILTTADILTTTPATRCSVGTLTLGATANSGSTINWYSNLTGGTSLATGTSYTTPSLSTTTTYYVDATQSGCTSNPRVPVVATVSPSTVAASVSISANPGTNLCSGNSVVFTATPTNGGTTPLYQWRKNGTNITGATNTSYTTNTLANNDVITCVMTVNPTNACITGSPATSNSLTMTVASMAASVSISANPNGTICSGNSVTFTATPTNGGAIPTYQWYNGATPISGATNSTYTTSSLTNGAAITCKMTSSFICATGNPATSNTVTTTVQDINAVVTDPSGGPKCPDFLGPFNAESGSYNPGGTVVVFKVERQLSTANWSFAFAVSGTDVSVYSLAITGDGTVPSPVQTAGNISGGTVDAKSSNYVVLTFTINNKPGEQLNVKLTVSNVVAGSCTETNTVDNIVTHTINSMPVVGSFN